MKENTNRVSDFPFIRFPAALVKLPCFKALSADAKLLYALIVDRFNLSIANKWRDENGTPYVYFSIDSVMESIGCAKAKAVKLMDALEDWGLIRRAKQGLGKPNRIYVLDPALLDQFENRTTLSTSSSTDQFDSDTSSEIKPVQTSSILRPVRLSNPRSLIFKPKKFDFQTLIRLSIIRLSLIRLKGQREKRKSRLWSAASLTRMQRKFFAEVLTKP